MRQLFKGGIRPLLALSLLLVLAACVAGPSIPTALQAPPPEAQPTVSTAPEATSTPDLPAMVMGLTEPMVLGTFPSPDGARTAAVIIYDCVATETGDVLAYDVLEISETVGGGRSVPASQLQYCSGLGAHGLQGLFWSPNSRYFYFTDARVGVPDGGCGIWLGSMARVDVQSGSVEDLGGAVVSPSGSSIASWLAGDLVVWSVNEPDAIHIAAAVPGAYQGPIAWSPAEDALAYVQTAESCPPWGLSTIVLHRLGDQASLILLESDAPSFVQAEWAEANRLRLIDDAGEAWIYNLAEKQLVAPGQAPPEGRGDRECLCRTPALE